MDPVSDTASIDWEGVVCVSGEGVMDSIGGKVGVSAGVGLGVIPVGISEPVEGSVERLLGAASIEVVVTGSEFVFCSGIPGLFSPICITISHLTTCCQGRLIDFDWWRQMF